MKLTRFDINFETQIAQCRLSARTKRTNPIYQRTDYLFVDSILLEPCNTTISMSYSKQRCGTHLQLIPEAHECTHSKHGAQSHRQQQPALSPVLPAKRPHQNAHAAQDAAAVPTQTCRQPNELLAPLKRGFT